MSEELMSRHPVVDEGELSWMRQAVVGRESCAAAAVAAGLPAMMVQAAPPARRAAAAELAERVSVRAALAEAAIGAGWLDLGPVATREAVLAAFAPALDAAAPGSRDAKTALQEHVQRGHGAVRYELVSSEGPPQKPVFTSRVLVDGVPMGEGVGRSKQASEQQAAAQALARLEADG